VTAALPYMVAAVVLAASWAGSLGYAAAMGCWLEVLGRAEIGLVYPMFTGATTILVMTASVVGLREHLGWRRVVGAALMIAGVFVAYLE